MVSKGIIEGSKVKVKENTVEVVVFPEMVAGQYKYPVRFGRPFNNSLNEKGFSDHLPVSVVLTENLQE